MSFFRRSLDLLFTFFNEEIYWPWNTWYGGLSKCVMWSNNQHDIGVLQGLVLKPLLFMHSRIFIIFGELWSGCLWTGRSLMHLYASEPFASTATIDTGEHLQSFTGWHYSASRRTYICNQGRREGLKSEGLEESQCVIFPALVEVEDINQECQNWSAWLWFIWSHFLWPHRWLYLNLKKFCQ